MGEGCFDSRILAYPRQKDPAWLVKQSPESKGLGLGLCGRGEDWGFEFGGTVFHFWQLDGAAQHGLTTCFGMTGQAKHGIDWTVGVSGGESLQPLLLRLDEMETRTAECERGFGIPLKCKLSLRTVFGDIMIDSHLDRIDHGRDDGLPLWRGQNSAADECPGCARWKLAFRQRRLGVTCLDRESGQRQCAFSLVK